MRRAALIGALVVWLLVREGTRSPVGAQFPEPWTPPIQLSEGVLDDSGVPAKCTTPALVADLGGSVHALWAAALQPGSDMAETVYYSRWDGSEWSRPIDIFYFPGTGVIYPHAAADDRGWLHLVWTGGLGSVWYSRAHASEAGSPRAWAPPVLVTEELAANAFVLADVAGRVHVVSCPFRGEGYLSYSSSMDGANWSVPLQITKLAGCFARLAVDGRLRLHLVFADQLGLNAGTVATYMRSDDGGATWPLVRQIDIKDGRYGGEYGPAYPNVVTRGDDEIHVVWDGAPHGQRWHQWSADGGETWSQPVQISAQQRGLTGPNALVVDSAGAVHLLSLGWLDTPQNPRGPWHTYWTEGSWWPLVHIGERTDWEALDPVLAISGGNSLHAAWWSLTEETDARQVWASSLQVNAPAVPVQALPTPRPRTLAAESQKATEVATTVTPVAPQTGVAYPPPGAAVAANSASSRVVLAAILPVLLLVGLVLLVQSWRRPG